MIKLYCKNNCKDSNKDGDLCNECINLIDYSKKRINLCRNKETKTFCSTCETHCYSPKMKESIKNVMRFSGPRMLIYNPKLATYHVICTTKHKLKKRKEKSK